MHTKLKRVALSLAALTAASAGLVLSSTPASAFPPDAPSVGPANLLPANGNISTMYTLTPTPPTASFCAGDSSAGYSVRTFMTPTSQDPGLLTYAAPVQSVQVLRSRYSRLQVARLLLKTRLLPRLRTPTGRILSLGNLSFECPRHRSRRRVLRRYRLRAVGG